MRTVMKFLVIFILVVLAASVATATLSTKSTTKTVVKLGSNTSLNKSNITASSATKIQTKIIVKPKANASVNQFNPLAPSARINSTTDQTHNASRIVNGSAKLQINKIEFSLNEMIHVYFEAPASFDKTAWVGIIPSNISHGSEKENDKYLGQLKLPFGYLEKRTSGTMNFTAPNNTGSYDIRMFDTDNDGHEIAAVSFKVLSNVSLSNKQANISARAKNENTTTNRPKSA